MVYLTVMLVNLAIIGLTAFVFHVTESFWAFLLLFFLLGVRNKRD